jgi:hypothetical protein
VPQNDDRRDPANALMEAIGEASINVDTLFKVLSTPPILNEQTCYTATMSAGTWVVVILVGCGPAFGFGYRWCGCDLLVQVCKCTTQRCARTNTEA